MGCQFRVNVAIIGSLDIRLNKVQLQSSFNFKSTAFCEFAFASCGFTENVFAVVAGDYGLGVTEDDVNEIKQDISSFRFELLDILGKNGMKTGQVNGKDGGGIILLLFQVVFLNNF